MNRHPDRVLIGVLTPSSNTRLEPLTAGILSALPEVSAHFSRFRVTSVAFTSDAVAQFDLDKILAAADLLADAQVDVIVWSGTSGGWIGLDADRELCARISARCGCPATTATLALLEALELAGVDTLGLVSPYPDDMQAAIVANLATCGIQVVAAANHAVTMSNWELSEIGQNTLSELVQRVAGEHPGVITTFCTNLAAADLVAGWEAEHDIPVFDSIAVAVWGGLRLAGVDPRRVNGWGRLFGLAD
jgi:maleate isomerase